MPNNNEKQSPYKAIPPQAIVPLVKGGIGGVTSGVANTSTEFGQIRDEFKEKGYKDAKFGKKLKMLGGAGARLFATGNQAVLGGISQGLLGTDFGLSNVGFLKDNQPGYQDPQEEQIAQRPTYSTNINAMGEEIPNKMMYKPFKALSPYTASYSAYNMSAKQANSEEKMKQISGADSALQANAFYAALNDAKEKGADTFKVGDKTFNVK